MYSRRMHCVACSVGMLCWAHAGASAQVCLSGPSYGTGVQPVPIAVADLNMDGRPDLVVGDQTDGTISVLLNNGDGTFAERVPYASGELPWGVAIGDLNGDMMPDVVVANLGTSSSNLSVRLNLGGGALGSAMTLTAGSRPITPVVTDIDGDHDNDILVANFSGDSFSVLRNEGGGVFAAPVEYQAGDAPQGFVCVDLDHDTFPDAVTANINANTISVFHNNQNGTFAAPVTYPAGPVPYYIAAGDLDGDGAPDLAVTNYNNGNTGSVTIFRNNGSGAFTPTTTVPAGVGPLGIAGVDLDGDCDLDLAIAQGTGSGIIVLLNDGSGASFTSRPVATTGRQYLLGVDDFNGDSAPDLASTNYFSSNGVTVLLNHCWVIWEQPQPRLVCTGGVASFSVSVPGTATVQWRKNGENLGDMPGHISGATSAMLTITGCTESDQATYDCVVTTGCAEVASAEVLLNVCPADFNCNGVANSQDFFDFLGAFFGGIPSADFNHDGIINSQDFFDFVGAFFTGC